MEPIGPSPPNPPIPRTAGVALAGVIASASKIAFLLLAITTCVGFLIGRFNADDFKLLTAMAFTYYFSSKGDPSKPYAGK
jgi:hypothetical protein